MLSQFRPQWDYHKYIFVGKAQSRSNGINLEMEADANVLKRRHGKLICNDFELIYIRSLV